MLRRRRMVRSYRPDPVDPAALERIAATIRRAPSAGFSQGQRLVVVTDPELRARIAELADEAEYVAAGFAPWISSSPVHVVVGVREADYHERYQEPDKLQADGTEIEWPVPYWFVDAGAAFMLVLLAAIDEGLAAGFFGLSRLRELRGLLGIPDDVTPVGVATIGRPAPDPLSDRASSRKSSRRKPLDELVHWERWGAVA